MALPAKILIADDTPAVRRSLRRFIEIETEWQICGEAENGRAAVDLVRELRPDVVLLDLSMPIMNGLEAAKRIRAMEPQVHVLMLTLYVYPELVREAHKAGVKDVISKSDGIGSHVLEAIRSVLA